MLVSAVLFALVYGRGEKKPDFLGIEFLVADLIVGLALLIRA